MVLDIARIGGEDPGRPRCRTPDRRRRHDYGSHFGVRRTAVADGRIGAQSGEADIFIYPGFDFRVVGAMLTNFHLPKSTLIMLVSAFAGREQTLAAYEHAVRERYRFYSYGDCMFVE